MLHKRLLIWGLLGLAFVLGCGSKQTPTPPPRPPSGTWTIPLFKGEQRANPIMASHVWIGDEIQFLLVPNFKPAGGGGGSGSGGLPYKEWFHGRVYLPDGKTEIGFHAETSDGTIETVTIDGKPFDLADGRLFFLSTNGEVSVRQMDQDTRQLTPEHEDSTEIEEFLRNVPEFEAFLLPEMDESQ